MTMQHTPGPWTCYLDEDKNVYGFRNAAGKHIATLDAPPRGCITATAILIAAAPDLLAACQEALTTLCDPYLGEDDGKRQSDAVAMLSAAIAKATTDPRPPRFVHDN